MKEELMNNLYLKEIYFEGRLFYKIDIEIIEVVFEKIFNYNHTIQKFVVDEFLGSIQRIMLRNMSLHHYLLFNFTFFDLVFVFSIGNFNKRKIEFYFSLFQTVQ
jgi:hypothetical protein